MKTENNLEEMKKMQEQIAKLELIAKNQMTNSAVSRYGTLKSAHPKKALQAATIIAQLVSQNQIQEKITDEQFKQLLISMEQ
ncbi:hypothetical protein J4216_01610 [Candidatus Woesearchaeota archaeon]|nr:hypothetical protein [Candidatus Woesearchaeota archaeon]